jgi:hypothetical protein
MSAASSVWISATATATGNGIRGWDRWSSRFPRLRHANYLPSFLELRRAMEQALTAVVQEAYVQGVSTRSVDELVKAAGMTGIASSPVSRLCQGIDERVQAFLERAIKGDWPFLWLDATYVKVRDNGRMISRACVIAAGRPFMQLTGRCPETRRPDQPHLLTRPLCRRRLVIPVIRQHRLPAAEGLASVFRRRVTD